MKKNSNEFNPNEDDDESGQTGAGGQSGEIAFRYRDIFAAEPRDDILSPDQVKQLLHEHIALHKEYVTKQRILRKDRKALKEGPVNLTTPIQSERQSKQYGVGLGEKSNYKMHPIALKAQFSGATDQKVVNIASINTAETNEENRDKLENRFQNQLRMTNAPKFNPKPRPY